MIEVIASNGVSAKVSSHVTASSVEYSGYDHLDKASATMFYLPGQYQTV